VHTAANLSKVTVSTLENHPSPSVKKPDNVSRFLEVEVIDSPLILESTVALATLVWPRDAFKVQLAKNQIKQNASARCSVSRTVKGGDSTGSSGSVGGANYGKMSEITKICGDRYHAPLGSRVSY
jgi:hypothetical protein